MIPARHPVFDGWIEVVLIDEETESVAISASVPACLFMIASPWMKEGRHGGIQIDSPLRAWVPAPSPEDMKEGMEGVRELIDSESKRMASNILAAFSQAGTVLKDVDSFVPMLPMGVYVKFSLRCGLSELARIVERMPDNGRGMKEMRGAMAGALAHSLERLGIVMKA